MFPTIKTTKASEKKKELGNGSERVVFKGTKNQKKTKKTKLKSQSHARTRNPTSSDCSMIIYRYAIPPLALF